jgi:hypothetical protein
MINQKLRNEYDTYEKCKYYNDDDNFNNNINDNNNNINGNHNYIRHKIKLKPGWMLLYYNNNKDICSEYIPLSTNININTSKYKYNEEYEERTRKDKIFDQYIKNINEERNIRKELYNEDFSYLDKYFEETYDIYTENDAYSSDVDSNDETDYYNYNDKKFDI